MKKLTCLALVAMISAASSFADAKTIFASVEGAGEKDGSSWDNATALDLANWPTLEDGDILYIKEGTYTYTGSKNITITPGATVIGGFASSSTGTDLTYYHPFLKQTILDANGKNGSKLAFIKVSGTSESGNPTTIKGVTITGATAEKSGTTFYGSAFNSTGKAVVFMEDVVFDKNTSWYGGVVVPAAGSSFYAKHCVWSNNKNVYVNSDEKVTSYSCVQSAMNLRSSYSTDGVVTAVLEGCSFYGNTSENYNKGTYGGLISCQDNGSNLAMINCYIDGGGQEIKLNGGMIRTGSGASNKTYYTFLFNTFYNAGVNNTSESKGQLISFNGGSNVNLAGNIFVTSKEATTENVKANGALFFQKASSGVTSLGYNTVSGAYEETSTELINTDSDTDNWFAPTQSVVFGGHKAIQVYESREYIWPIVDYGDIPAEDFENMIKKDDNGKYTILPDCFSFAPVDLSVDMFDSKRCHDITDENKNVTGKANTYRGAFDANSSATTGVKDIISAKDGVTVKALGNGEYAVKGAKGVVEVFDMAGRKVLSQYVDGDAVLSLSNVAAGVYVARVANTAVKIMK